MKNVLFILTMLLSSFIVKGNPSPNEEIFKYSVLSITQCKIVDNEVYAGKTSYPKDGRIVVVTDTDITVYIPKTTTRVTFDILNFELTDDGLIYATKHRQSGDKVLILINRNGISYTFSFINTKEGECFIYKTEYFE